MFILKSKLWKFRTHFRQVPKMAYSTDTNTTVNVNTLRQMLGISSAKAEYIVLKQPSVCNLQINHLQKVTETMEQLGINKLELSSAPVNFTYLPVTLKYRHKVLKECGFDKVTAVTLSGFLTLAKRKTIAQLKAQGYIPPDTEVIEKLANVFTQWPTSNSPSLLKINESNCTLYEARMKVLQRYLELVLDLPEDKFVECIQIYKCIYHRPFELINETLNLLQNHVLMSPEKIKSNFFLVHADPENIKRILHEVRSIGGVNIKEVIKMRPKFCTTNVENILKMREIFKKYGFSEAAQVRCLEIFTLSSRTVQERLERAKTIPQFEVLQNHPRILRIIYYENNALKRMETLLKMNKKCFSLNILSGSEEHYKVYAKAPGDRTKGTDLVRGLSAYLGSQHSRSEIREKLKRHQFWINVPLLQAISVYKQLATQFSSTEIYDNCSIVLYPWYDIDKVLRLLAEKPINNCSHQSQFPILEHIDISKLTKSQVLSLTVYFLEINHYFSGNGIWSVERTMKNCDSKDEQSVNEVTPGVR